MKFYENVEIFFQGSTFENVSALNMSRYLILNSKAWFGHIVYHFS